MQHVWRPCGATMRAARALQLAVEHVSVWGLSLCYDAAPTLIVAVVAGCVRASCASYPAKLEWACCDVPLAPQKTPNYVQRGSAEAAPCFWACSMPVSGRQCLQICVMVVFRCS